MYMYAYKIRLVIVTCRVKSAYGYETPGSVAGRGPVFFPVIISIRSISVAPRP